VLFCECRGKLFDQRSRDFATTTGSRSNHNTWAREAVIKTEAQSLAVQLQVARDHLLRDAVVHRAVRLERADGEVLAAAAVQLAAHAEQQTERQDNND
jgi:hypothetical protein